MMLQIMFLLGLEFQPPPASLDLVHFPFDSVYILKVERFIVVSFLHIFTFGNLFPLPPSLLKLVVRPGLETILSH